MRGIPGSDDDLMVQTFHSNLNAYPRQHDAVQQLRAELSDAVLAEA